MSCMPILYLKLHITRSDIRAHIKWAVRLVVAYGHFNLPRGFVWVFIGLTYSLYHPRYDRMYFPSFIVACLSIFCFVNLYINCSEPAVFVAVKGNPCEAVL